MSQIKGIIFDLDGTLIDSVTDLAGSVNYTLKKVGLPGHTREEVRQFVGDGVSQLIKRSLGQTHLDKFDESLGIFMDHYGAHCTDSTVLYPGVDKVLSALAGEYLLAVLTNKGMVFTRTILHNLGIANCFKEVLGGDSLPTKKPEPAGIFYLAEKWGFDPAGEIIMVGDHATDIEVGRRAGCRTVFVSGGIGVTRDLPPDFVIESILELPDLLKNL